MRDEICCRKKTQERVKPAASSHDLGPWIFLRFSEITCTIDFLALSFVVTRDPEIPGLGVGLPGQEGGSTTYRKIELRAEQRL